MKLLFDQNLSSRLVTKLADHYPDFAYAASVSNSFVGAALAAKTENRYLTPLTWVSKFKISKQEVLLSYSVGRNELLLIALSHSPYSPQSVA